MVKTKEVTLDEGISRSLAYIPFASRFFCISRIVSIVNDQSLGQQPEPNFWFLTKTGIEIYHSETTFQPYQALIF